MAQVLQPGTAIQGMQVYPQQAMPAVNYGGEFVAGERPPHPEKKFVKLNCCAFLVSLAIFCCLVSALLVPWYKDERETNVDGTITGEWITFDAYGYSNAAIKDNTEAAPAFTAWNEMDEDLKAPKIFLASFAFAALATILVTVLALMLLVFFFTNLRVKCTYCCSDRGPQIITLLLGVLILLSVTVSALVFVGVTKAFKDDRGTSAYTAIANDDAVGCIAGPCNSFFGSLDNQKAYTALGLDPADLPANAQFDWWWRPTAGWWLTLVCIPLSLIVLGVLATNNFPHSL
jgi:hypothetical protein